MGTRSLTRIFDGDTVLVAMYRQYDGYLSGHGRDLANILGGKEMVNGFQSADQKAFNGPGCMAAAIIAGCKSGIGGTYIQAPDAEDEEFTYEIRNTTVGEGFGMTYNRPQIKVTNRGDVVFEGTVEEFCEAVMDPEYS